VNKTLQQIKDSLPKYRYLTPGVDVWREGDEVVDLYQDEDITREFWNKKSPLPIGTFLRPMAIGRRPIPDEVLENQAFWVLYNKLATVAPDNKGYIMLPKFGGVVASRVVDTFGLYKFISEPSIANAIPLLGGEQNIIKHLSIGDAYSVWLGEQLT
jgi:hypothetical protein